MTRAVWAAGPLSGAPILLSWMDVMTSVLFYTGLVLFFAALIALIRAARPGRGQPPVLPGLRCRAASPAGLVDFYPEYFVLFLDKHRSVSFFYGQTPGVVEANGAFWLYPAGMAPVPVPETSFLIGSPDALRELLRSLPNVRFRVDSAPQAQSASAQAAAQTETPAPAQTPDTAAQTAAQAETAAPAQTPDTAAQAPAQAEMAAPAQTPDTAAQATAQADMTAPAQTPDTAAQAPAQAEMAVPAQTPDTAAQAPTQAETAAPAQKPATAAQPQADETFGAEASGEPRT